MRLVAYTRLSQSNAHEDESHEAQLARITTWAEANGHEVVVHRRETISGLVSRDAGRRALQDLENHIEKRVALGDALNDLQDDAVDAVVVDVQDRLSRDPTILEIVLIDIWRTGKAAISVLQGDLGEDPDDPTQEMIRTIVSAADRYAAKITKLRMARGRKRTIARGGRIGPAPTFGWRKAFDDPVKQQGGRYEPDPGEFPLVEEAVRRKNGGSTLREVAAWLADETGRPWHPTQVKRLCERHDRYAKATP